MRRDTGPGISFAPRAGVSLRVLIVSDSERDTHALITALQHGGYEPTYRRVDTPTGMSEALARDDWDLVIADEELRHCSGLAALMLLLNRNCDMPCIVVSRHADDRGAASLMRAGAHDYVRRRDLARLAPAVARELQRADERRAHRHSEEALRRRGEYLTCLTEVSAELLAATDLDFTLPRVLKRLREVARADRCYVFQNYAGANGTLMADQRLEDCAPEIESRFNITAFSTVSWREAGLARWAEVMSSGTAIHGAVDNLPQSERQFLAAQGVVWVVALPLRVAGEWYGFVGFDACSDGLTWTDQEISVLRAAASAIAAAIRRVRVEERLRESEARYRALAENTYDLICETDSAGRLLYVSPNYRDVLGYEPTELLGRKYTELIHPADRGSATPTVAPANGSAPVGQATFRYQHRNGDWRWFESTNKTFRTAIGDTRVVAVSRDITERKWAEHRIERLNRVVRAIRDIDRLITREKDRHRLLRTACEILVGASDYHLVWIGLVDDEQQRIVPVVCAGRDGLSDEQLDLGREGDGGLRDPAWLAYSSGRPSVVSHGGWVGCGQESDDEAPANDHSRVIVPLQSGEHRFGVLSVCARQEAFDEEEVELLVEVAGDIAFALAVMAMDAELQTYHNHLEELVQQRTTELAAMNRELEAFCYSVSHDLRAPLRSIDGFSQMLLEDYADRLEDDGRENLRRVRAASQRMAHLIDDLLELSRLTRSELRRERVDVSSLVRAVANDLRQTQPARKVTFDIADDLVADADPQLLRVMLENLLANAWKFTTKHPEAHIEFGVIHHENEDVYYVRDDGAGFDMAYAGKLFGAFQRLHGVAEFEGTGIGLATVQRIIERHGGRIWAEGEVEQGATFYFTL